MKRKLKTIANVIFLLLGGMPFLFVVSFKIRQEIIRHNMRERLEEQLLQQVTINDKDVQWIEKDEEILVDGKMFDIKTVEHHNGASTFTGLFDNEETGLMLRLEETQDQNSASSNKLLTDFFHWLGSVYNDTYRADSPVYTDSNHEYLLIASTLHDQFIAIVIPPPKIC